MNPVVRYLLLCDDVQTDPNNVLRLNVTGLITHIRATGNPPFPVVRPIFCALLILTDCEGVGELSLRIVEDSTGRVIFRNPTRRVRFAGPPGDAVGVVFRVLNCRFDEPGLYWVELIFSGMVLASQPFTLTC
jgi:hypothetical protein